MFGKEKKNTIVSFVNMKYRAEASSYKILLPRVDEFFLAFSNVT